MIIYSCHNYLRTKILIKIIKIILNIQSNSTIFEKHLNPDFKKVHKVKLSLYVCIMELNTAFIKIEPPCYPL